MATKQRTEAQQKAFLEGLEAAAAFLEGNASDFQQILDRLQNDGRHRTQMQQQDIAILRDKVSLLRGQAMHVRNLR